MKGASRLTSIVFAALCIELLILLATGVGLYFIYRPTPGQAWGTLVTGPDPVTASGLLRAAHQVTAAVTVPTVLVAAGRVVTSTPGGVRWTVRLLGAGMVVVTVAAGVTGVLLPWDQLALSAPTVGQRIAGYDVLFDDAVRFVLVRNAEVSPEAILGWLSVHTLLLAPALFAMVIVAWRRNTSARRT